MPIIIDPIMQSEKVEYTDKHSYSAIMHKMAYDGITGMIKSKENVTKMREVFKNDIGHFEERLKKLLRSYFQIARNHIPPQVKEEVSCSILGGLSNWSINAGC